MSVSACVPDRGPQNEMQDIQIPSSSFTSRRLPSLMEGPAAGAGLHQACTTTHTHTQDRQTCSATLKVHSPARARIVSWRGHRVAGPNPNASRAGTKGQPPHTEPALRTSTVRVSPSTVAKPRDTRLRAPATARLCLASAPALVRVESMVQGLAKALPRGTPNPDRRNPLRTPTQIVRGQQGRFSVPSVHFDGLVAEHGARGTAWGCGLEASALVVLERVPGVDPPDPPSFFSLVPATGRRKGSGTPGAGLHVQEPLLLPQEVALLGVQINKS